MINDETFNYCIDFIPEHEIEKLEELTGFGSEEILDDYLLTCTLLKTAANYATWSNYKKEQEEIAKEN